MSNIPRCEHPRPDRLRQDWQSLNGVWDFEIDNAKVGLEKKFYERDNLDGKINVDELIKKREAASSSIAVAAAHNVAPVYAVSDAYYSAFTADTYYAEKCYKIIDLIHTII